jgi:hypothetical protein
MYYGPAYHPWGFFLATMAATAIVVSVAAPPPATTTTTSTTTTVHTNVTETRDYYYDQGTWYMKDGDGYVVVAAPVGATVKSLPSEAEQLVINNTTTYFYGGAFYEKAADGY